MKPKTVALIVAVGLLFAGAVFVNAASRVVEIICVGAIIGIFWLRDQHKSKKLQKLAATIVADQATIAGYDAAVKRLETELAEANGKVSRINKLRAPESEPLPEKDPGPWPGATTTIQIEGKEDKGFAERTLARFRPFGKKEA